MTNAKCSKQKRKPDRMIFPGKNQQCYRPLSHFFLEQSQMEDPDLDLLSWAGCVLYNFQVLVFMGPHRPVWVQRCGEHDGFDKKAKHTLGFKFDLLGNPACIVCRCKQGKPSFYIWLRQKNITNRLFITLQRVYPFTKLNLAQMRAGEDASR